MTAPSVGTPGRSVSEVGTSGRVEVAGVAYHASTGGRPIPAGSAIVVTGWRLDNDGPNERLVLLVRRPDDDGSTDPSPPLPPLPDAHFVAGFPPPQPPPTPLMDLAGDDEGNWLLTCGQVAAVIASLLIVLGVIAQLVALSDAEQRMSGYQTSDSGPLPWPASVFPKGANDTRQSARADVSLFPAKALVVAIGGITLCLFTALYVLFERAKAMRRVAEAQDAVNRRLWQAIHEVRRMPPADGTG